MLVVEAHNQLAREQIPLPDFLLKQTANAVVATNLDGAVVYWNSIAQHLYQWQRVAVLGRNIYELIIPEHQHKQVAAMLDKLVHFGEAWNGELILQRQDGSQFLADVNITPIKDPSGEVTGFISVAEDTSETKVVQTALQQSEANLKAIFNSSLQAFVLIDRCHKIQAFNKTANYWSRKLCHKEMQKGDSIYDYVCEEYFNDFSKNLKSALQGELIKTEKPLRAVDGKTHWFEFNYCPVLDENQEVVGVCQVGINIDRQKKAIDELARREERFRWLLQNCSDVIAILQENGKIDYISPSVERILGYQPESVIGDDAFRYVHPEDWQAARNKFTETLKHPGVVFSTELRLCHADGTWIYVEFVANNLLNEASTKGVVVNCRDITQRKQAEVALQQQREREKLMGAIAQNIRQSLNLNQILHTTVAEVRKFLQADRVLIYRFQPECGREMEVEVESVSNGWAPVLGTTTIDDCFIKNHLQPYQQGHIQVVEDIYTSGLSRCHIDLLSKFQVKANMVVPILQGENLWGLLIVHQCSNSRQWQPWEVDLLKQLSNQVGIAIQQAQLYQQLSEMNADLERQIHERTAEMQEKVKELQKLNLLKDDFLSTVSHELRTPLANMKMAIQMVKLAPTGERRQRYVEILQSECNRESDLINDLLDLQRLEAASNPVTLESINLQAWLQPIVEPFYSRSHENQQNLLLELPETIPPIMSDRNGLERIVVELLNNACKYTQPGGTIITDVDLVTQSDKLNSQTLIKFTISNQAEIPADELPKIFQKFYRVPYADRWKKGGTGLGLALVQKLVEQLEGTIEVASCDGWTKFIVMLPVNPSDSLKANCPKLLV